MENKSIGFVRYLKLSQESDAFFQSDKFTPYLEAKLSSNFSSNKLDYDKYTAGNTENPDDYTLPDIEDILLPEKIIRINPFNKSQKTKYKTYNYSNSPYYKDLNDCDDENNQDQIATDAYKFIELLKNNKTSNKKTKNTELINLSQDNYEENYFVLNPRSFDVGVVKHINENISLSQDGIIKKENKNPSNITNIVEKNDTNNIFNYSSNNNTSRIQNTYQEFEYDLNNFTSNFSNDFTINNTTTKIINEVKTEIINNVNETVNKMETRILNQTVTNNEMKNIQNNIVQTIENKIIEKENQILEKIQEKSKKDFANFKNNLLNS